MTDIALQMKAKYGDKMTFIHQEVYADNDPNKGLRKPLQQFNLRVGAVAVRRRRRRQGDRPARGLVRPEDLRERGQDRPLARAVRRTLPPLLIAATALVAFPRPASAHGLVQRSNLPIPEWLFGWAAAIVLVISFVALAALWPKPRLEGARRGGRCPAARVLGSEPVEIAVRRDRRRAAGRRRCWPATSARARRSDNFAPTFILITFWVGLVFASAIFGDVFRAFSPWRAIGPRCCRREGLRAVPGEARPLAGRRRPAGLHVDRAGLGLGRGPGAARHRRARLHGAHAGRAGRLRRRDLDRATARRSPSTSTSSRASSPFETRDRVVGVRPPLVGPARSLDPVPGTVALVSVMIGTVTFDGLSQGRLWKDLAIELTDVVTSARDPDHRRAEGRLDDRARRSASRSSRSSTAPASRARARSAATSASERLRRAFMHSLVPIAMVYVAAHYLTFLLFEGQAIRYLASRPVRPGLGPLRHRLGGDRLLRC